MLIVGLCGSSFQCNWFQIEVLNSLFEPLVWNSGYGVSLALKEFVFGLNGIKGLELAMDRSSAPL
jgi:hypothetical protein